MGWLKLCRWARNRETPGRAATMQHKFNSTAILSPLLGFARKYNVLYCYTRAHRVFRWLGFFSIKSTIKGDSPFHLSVQPSHRNHLCSLVCDIHNFPLSWGKTPGSFLPSPIIPTLKINTFNFWLRVNFFSSDLGLHHLPTTQSQVSRGVQLCGSHRDGQDSAFASQHPQAKAAGGEVGVSGHRDGAALGATTFPATQDNGLGQEGEEKRRVTIFPALHHATEWGYREDLHHIKSCPEFKHVTMASGQMRSAVPMRCCPYYPWDRLNWKPFSSSEGLLLLCQSKCSLYLNAWAVCNPFSPSIWD